MLAKEKKSYVSVEVCSPRTVSICSIVNLLASVKLLWTCINLAKSRVTQHLFYLSFYNRMPGCVQFCSVCNAHSVRGCKILNHSHFLNVIDVKGKHAIGILQRIGDMLGKQYTRYVFGIV